jgi:hypothetical protein
VYCHENEHARVLDESLRRRDASDQPAVATHNPFAKLKDMLTEKK